MRKGANFLFWIAVGCLIATTLPTGFSGCGKTRERCVSCPDPEARSCAAMTRAFDACGLAPAGLSRPSALAACEGSEAESFWDCAQACYDLYDECGHWSDCLEYCENPEDDDDTWVDDDDTWWDDDTWSDDDTAPLPRDCESAFVFMYETCGFALVDEDGNEISMADAISACEAGDDLFPDIENCIVDLAPNCDDIADCINALFKGGRS